MVDSSKDILFLTLAAAIVVVTFFLAWALYLGIHMLRDLRMATRSVRQNVEKAGEVLDLLKEKIAASTSYLGIIAEGAKQVLRFWQGRKRRTKTSRIDDSDEG